MTLVANLALRARVRLLRAEFNRRYQALDAKGLVGYGPGNALFEARCDLNTAEPMIGRRKHAKAVEIIDRLEKEWTSCDAKAMQD